MKAPARLVLAFALVTSFGVSGHPTAASAQESNFLMRSVVTRGPGCLASLFTDLAFAKDKYGGSRVENTPTVVGGQNQTIYGSAITRVGAVTGAAFSATGFGSQGTVPWNNTISGTWGADNRHHYTKDTPWNADGSLYVIENPTNTVDSTGTVANPSATGPTKVILRTSDWSPTSFFQCVSGGDSIRDYRWHPTNPNWMIVLKQTSSGASADTNYNNGDYVAIIDVTTCKIVRRTPVVNEGGNKIIKANLLGAGEGSVTADGSKIMLLTLHRQNNPTRPDSLQVVDLNTMTLGTPFPAPTCSLDVDGAGGNDCNIGHASLAPSGTLAWILYASDDAGDGNATIDTTDAVRVFDVSGTTITGVHAFARDTLCGFDCSQATNRCFCATSLIGGVNKLTGSTGWVTNLKHADAILDPFTGHDCLIGATRCGATSNQGKIGLVDLQTGRFKRLDSSASLGGQANEGAVVHVSGRNSNAPGWVFVSFDDASGTSPRDELVAVRTDGSGKMVRLAEIRTRDTAYRSEAHPVPDWGGKRCAVASNWVYNCTTCGVINAPKDYIISWPNLCEP